MYTIISWSCALVECCIIVITATSSRCACVHTPLLRARYIAERTVVSSQWDMYNFVTFSLIVATLPESLLSSCWNEGLELIAEYALPNIISIDEIYFKVGLIQANSGIFVCQYVKGILMGRALMFLWSLIAINPVHWLLSPLQTKQLLVLETTL